MDDRSEYETTKEMAAALAALGVKAEHIPTGGGCYAASIELTKWAEIRLTDASGEWVWNLYNSEGEHVVGGYWEGSESVADTAAKAKALVDAMGTVQS